MRNNEKVQHISCPLAPVERSQFSTLTSAGVPEGPEKFNNTEVPDKEEMCKMEKNSYIL
jgi:hypothetical protein